MAKHLPPLNALRTFTVAARCLSFTKAAESLCVTQGAVSRQVKVLEDWMGVPLFHRATKGLQLTPDGMELAKGVDFALSHVATVIEQIKHATHPNTLNINIPPTFATRWLAPRLAGFRKRYPHIDLSITNEVVSHPRDAKPYQCLITFGQQGWPDRDSRLLMNEQHVLVASPELWHEGSPPQLEDATLLHVLNGEARLPLWENWIKAFFQTHINTAPGISFSTLDQAINTAIMGGGVAIVDAVMVSREITNGSLRRVNQLELPGSYGYWFVSNASDSESEDLVSLFRNWMQSLISLEKNSMPIFENYIN